MTATAVVERFILTMNCLLSCSLLVPYRRETVQRELDAIHPGDCPDFRQAKMGLSSSLTPWGLSQFSRSENGTVPFPDPAAKVRTPDEVYYGKYPANRRPRFEPRDRWPRGSPCAKPWALVRSKPGVKLTLEVTFHPGHRHLPVVTLKRAA